MDSKEAFSGYGTETSARCECCLSRQTESKLKAITVGESKKAGGWVLPLDRRGRKGAESKLAATEWVQ